MKSRFQKESKVATDCLTCQHEKILFKPHRYIYRLTRVDKTRTLNEVVIAIRFRY